jgi:hypothetical protein
MPRVTVSTALFGCMLSLCALAGGVDLLLVAAPRATATVVRGTTPTRCQDRPKAERKACVGPVTDTSGGGGDTLTIALSIAIGIGVAAVAWVLLRRQLRGASEPPGAGVSPRRDGTGD